jgi:hypothetical protein
MKTIFAKALPDCGGGNIKEFELKHMKPNQAMNETQTAPLLQNTPASAVGIPRGHHNVTPVRINISSGWHTAGNQNTRSIILAFSFAADESPHVCTPLYT